MAKKKQPYDEVSHEPPEGHAVDIVIERRFPMRKLVGEIRESTDEMVAALGERRGLWLKVEELVAERAALREEAYFNIGYEHGKAAGRARAIRSLAGDEDSMPRDARKLASTLRDLAVQADLPRPATVAALLETAWALVVGPLRHRNPREERIMNDATRNLIASLEGMRLPELQAKYTEFVGEESRCPNKRFLIRRITEALESGQVGIARAPSTSGGNTTVDAGRNESGDEKKRLSKMSVSELQSLYREVVGRDTSSSDARYLVWKVRQAQKGSIPVGPRGRRRPNGEAVDFKVLPLRMEAEQVQRLDDARERLGLSSRMDLFRRALHAFFESQGEGEVAALFSSEA